MDNLATFEPLFLPLLKINDILYRLIVYDDWIDKQTKKIQSQAFLRRDKDRNGLSVCIAEYYSLEKCKTDSRFNFIFGVGGLQVHHIKSLGLGIEPDTMEHANIKGLPLRGEDDKRRNDLAEDLAEFCNSYYAWINENKLPN